jgi:hypothetical protein
MSNTAKFVLVFIGLALFIALLIVGVFYGITQVIRKTAQEALSPVTNMNQTLSTRVAEMLNPTPTIIPNPATIIHEIRSLARLETIQYTIEKVITAEQGQGDLGFLFGDRLLFVAHGTVIGGVDLAWMQPEDIWVDNESLYVVLPPTEIFLVDIDNEKSYVYDRETGILTKGNSDLERTARIAAEREIYQSALNDGILNQARENAENYMSRLLRGLGYQNVIFIQATPEPTILPTPLP